MIRFERTFDLALVRSIMTRPEIYPGLADDFYPSAENFRPFAGAALFHLLAFDDERGGELLGLFVTHPINAVLWEVHHALLPSAWGARAHRVGIAFESWLWENTQAQTAVGFTPASNRLALRYARRHGMTEVGRIPLAIARRSRLEDILIFAKHRPR